MHTRRQSLVRRTNRSFAAMLAWGLITAVVSLVAVNSLVGTLRSQSRHAVAEATFLGTLQPLLNEAEGAGHDLVTMGDEGLDWFRTAQDELAGVLDEGMHVLGGDEELAALADVRAAVGAMYEPLHVIAADAGVEADVAALQDHLGVHGELVRTNLYALDGIVRDAAGAELAEGEQAQRRLTVVLAVLFALSLAMTLYFARRVRRDVVLPVQSLGASARRFADGDLQHRSDVDSPEEFAALADSFNAMAEVLGASHQELAHQLSHDALTGVTTRRAFVSRLDREIGDGALDIGVIFVDLDDFKAVNDTLGHLGGDQVLQQVAARITESVRATDVVARFGGDEFAVLLAPPADHTVASSVAARILDRLAEPVEALGATIEVGASVGVALRALTGGGAEELLNQADTAMYSAKRAGKNRYEVFNGV